MKIAIYANGPTFFENNPLQRYLHKIIDRPVIAYPITMANKFENSGTYIIGLADTKTAGVVKNLFPFAEFISYDEAPTFFSKFDEEVLVIQGDDCKISEEVISSLIFTHTKLKNDVTTVKNTNKRSRTHHPYLVNSSKFNSMDRLLDQSAERIYYTNINYAPKALTFVKEVSLAAGLISHQNCTALEEIGVTIVDTNHASTFIGIDVTADAGAVIYPNTWLTGKTHISSCAEIMPNSRIEDSTIGTFTRVDQSVITSSTVGNNTTVGPFAHIRPTSTVGSHCRVGNFVEVKNTAIADNSKAGHLTYLGDSVIGSKVNIGCGTITANYDGKEKLTTTIQDNVFVGSNSILVAPVTIGEGSTTAAGSVITNEVPPCSLGIARSRQIVKEGWANKNQ